MKNILNIYQEDDNFIRSDAINTTSLTSGSAKIVGDLSIGGSCLVDYNIVAPTILPTVRFQSYGTSTLANTYITGITTSGSIFVSTGDLLIASGGSIKLSIGNYGPPATDRLTQKIMLYPSQVNNVDYGLGVESLGLWFSVPDNINRHYSWYGGTTLCASLSVANSLLSVGSINCATFNTGTNTLGSTLITSGNLVIGDGASSYLKLPSLTTTQRDALTASNGMIIYNSTLNKLQARENGAWANLI